MRDIGKNIRDLRTKQNMTQDELAEKLFVTRQTVSNYETGRSRPDVEMLTNIAEALNTDPNTLLYGPAPSPNIRRALKQLVPGVDGDFGKYTRDALKNYQKDAGIEVDGKAGTETFQSFLKE